MVNSDKIKKEFIEELVQNQANLENQKYGEFIKQTGEVQLFLALAVLQYSSFPDKGYIDHLFDRAELGTLIGLFQACAKKQPASYLLVLSLKRYNEHRRRLAHKMFSSKKLTPVECEAAIIEGKHILTMLRKLAKLRSKKNNQNLSKLK